MMRILTSQITTRPSRLIACARGCKKHTLSRMECASAELQECTSASSQDKLRVTPALGLESAPGPCSTPGLPALADTLCGAPAEVTPVRCRTTLSKACCARMQTSPNTWCGAPQRPATQACLPRCSLVIGREALTSMESGKCEKRSSRRESSTTYCARSLCQHRIG